MSIIYYIKIAGVCTCLTQLYDGRAMSIIYYIKIAGVCTCLTQLYDGRAMYIIYYIKNNCVFRLFSLAIFRLRNKGT